MTNAEHHLEERRKISKKQPFPHPTPWKRILDKLIYVVGILRPILTIPQITKVWVEKNASGVSPITWASYFLISIILLFYGIVHKEKPLVVMYSCWIVADIVVLIGTLIYS